MYREHFVYQKDIHMRCEVNTSCQSPALQLGTTKYQPGDSENRVQVFNREGQAGVVGKRKEAHIDVLCVSQFLYLGDIWGL